MSKPSPARYRTTNWSSYNDALRRRGSLLVWFDREMVWLAPRDGRHGRPPVAPDLYLVLLATWADASSSRPASLLGTPTASVRWRIGFVVAL